MSDQSYDQAWRERMVRDLQELKTLMTLGNQKVDSLDTRINGRIKRLEKTVFGDEEMKVIGLAEKSRDESREIRSLNKRWAIIIAGIVFVAQHAANYMMRKMDGGKGALHATADEATRKAAENTADNISNTLTQESQDVH